MTDLAGRIAVVTGAGSGLGAAMAELFASEGMAIAALDIDDAAAAATAEGLTLRHQVPTTSIRTDVGDGSSVTVAAAHVRAALGGCDVLCVNVGVQQFGAIERLTDDDWAWVLNVNVIGAARTIRDFLPLIRERTGWRRIVLTASASALAPSPRMAAYQSSKYAVMAIGETLRLELAGEGIGVTTIFPHGMMTRHLESSIAARPAELGTTSVDQEDLDVMLAHIPMVEGDIATPSHAIRNLLADLEADEPFSITHGSFRPYFQRRVDALDAAFDRMATQ